LCATSAQTKDARRSPSASLSSTSDKRAAFARRPQQQQQQQQSIECLDKVAAANAIAQSASSICARKPANAKW